MIILTTEQLKRISVKRIRPSVTQGFAAICVDGVEVDGLCFNDEPVLKCGKWVNESNDISFIKAALHHKYDYIYRLREKVIKALGI